MKIKKIIDLCKKSGTLCLYEGAAAQWISDGSAFYPLYDVPGFDENTLCRTFDITEKQQSKIRFGFDVYLPAAYCFDDHTEGEILCEQSPVSIEQGTSVLIACRTTRGIMFLDRKYLVPLENTAGRMPEIYERTAENGQLYFAVKSGLILAAVVLPCDIISTYFVGQLRALYEQCCFALQNRSSDGDGAEQQSMFGSGEGEPGAEDKV